MGEFKGTKGPVYIHFGGMPGDDGFAIASKGVEGIEQHTLFICESWPVAVDANHRVVMKANADLICEAFNVLDATGRTPRELAEQNAALLAHLREFHECSIASCRAWDEHRLYRLWHDVNATMRKFNLSSTGSES